MASAVRLVFDYCRGRTRLPPTKEIMEGTGLSRNQVAGAVAQLRRRYEALIAQGKISAPPPWLECRRWSTLRAVVAKAAESELTDEEFSSLLGR